MSTSRIVVVGSHAPGLLIRVKRVPRAGETVLGWDFAEPQDGGKGSNQAIAAARLGGNVGFVGCVGKDRIGDEGSKWMAEAGIDIRFLKRHAGVGSGVGFIVLDEMGIPAMITSMGANAELHLDDVEAALNSLSDATIFLTQFEIPVELALDAARLARMHGMTTIVNPAPAPDGIPAGLEWASVLAPNESEALAMLQMDAGAECAPVWLAEEVRRRSGAETVLVTLGAKGVAGCDATGSWHVSAPQVQVVDTSGAGDVFCAGLAVALSEGSSIRAASVWACHAASASVTCPGTIPAFPRREEIVSRINTDGSLAPLQPGM